MPEAFLVTFKGTGGGGAWLRSLSTGLQERSFKEKKQKSV